MNGQGPHPETGAAPENDAPAPDAGSTTPQSTPAQPAQAAQAAQAVELTRQDVEATPDTAPNVGAAPNVAASEARPREKPPLGGLIHYLLGGTLPPRYNEWVSNDLTGPGWRVRQALRPFFLMIPFAVVFALLPGPLNVRVTIVVFLLLSGIGMGFATSGYFRNRRLEQHGFPPIFPPSED